MKITINNKDIELKIGFKAFLLYEQIADKSYTPESLSDIIMFYFAVVYSSDKTKSITFDTFIDWLDDNPDSMNEFSQLVENYNTRSKDVEKEQDQEVTKEQIDEAKKN